MEPDGSLIIFQCVCSLFWLFLWGTVGYFLGKKKTVGPVVGVFLSI
jgi:hypothetical protein